MSMRSAPPEDHSCRQAVAVVKEWERGGRRTSGMGKGEGDASWRTGKVGKEKRKQR